MSVTAPLSVTQEAADFIAASQLGEPFQKILDSLPQRMPGLESIAVCLVQPYDLGGEPRVVLDVTREPSGLADDPTDRHWQRWAAETFSPEILQSFILMSNYGPNHAGKSIP